MVLHSHFSLEKVTRSHVGPAWYKISYQDQLDRCFTISGLAAPIAGDPKEYETISLSNETFGEVILLHTFFDESLIPPRITASIVIPVASSKHKYEFLALSNMQISENVRCTGTVVSLEEAAAIIESLQYFD